jgi:hypothetical protein
MSIPLEDAESAHDLINGQEESQLLNLFLGVHLPIDISYA